MPASIHAVKEQFADCGVCPRTGIPIRLCYNVFEGPDTSPASASEVPTILLIMGLASPAPFWDDAFCTTLASKGPCRVIRFDNRDIGLSTHLDHPAASSSSSPASSSASSPSASAMGDASSRVYRSGSDEFSTTGILKLIYAALQPGRRVLQEVYSVEEMALDALRLLAALGVRRNVHLVGMSLGGVIAQTMALRQPRLVASLTLVSTRSANPRQSRWPSLKEMVGFLTLVPRGSVSAQYASRIAAATTAAEKERLKKEREAERARVYGKAFARFVEKLAGDKRKIPFDLKRCEYQMGRVFLRSSYMGGCQRQFLALLNASSQDDAIRQSITATPSGAVGPGRTYMPTLVLHGSRDVLSPVENGRYLHRLYAGSTYHEIDGMGHTLPPSLRNQIVSWIWGNVARGEAALKTRPGAAAPPPQTTPVMASKL